MYYTLLDRKPHVGQQPMQLEVATRAAPFANCISHDFCHALLVRYVLVVVRSLLFCDAQAPEWPKTPLDAA